MQLSMFEADCYEGAPGIVIAAAVLGAAKKGWRPTFTY